MPEHDPILALPYVHEPLPDNENTIRLLRLEPPQADEEHDPPICCELQAFDLDDSPPYQALSYMWGSESPTDHIHIQDRRFTVRRNLHNYLKAARRNEWVESWIWIDQISINQANVLERNTQVQLMGRIFSGAEEVCIWLGDQGEAGNATITGLAEEVRKARHLVAETEQDVEDYHDAARRILKVDPSLITEMLPNPYWERLWVAQEIYLAKAITISCSGSQLQWDDVRALENYFRWTVELGDKSSEYRTPNGMAMLWRRLMDGPVRTEGLYFNKGRPLLETLAWFDDAICFEPRDYIYGLMGMTQPEERICVDYSKPMVEVFFDCLLKINATEIATSFDQSEGLGFMRLACQMGLLGDRNSLEDEELGKLHKNWRILRVLLQLFMRHPEEDLEPLEFVEEYHDSAYSHADKREVTTADGSTAAEEYLDDRPLAEYVMRHDLQLPELQERLRLYQKIIESGVQV